MKKKIIILVTTFIFTFLFSLTSFASNNEEEGNIENYIYEIINDYENGVFTERNDLNDIDVHQLFSFINDENNRNVRHIYDNRQIGAESYVASRISFYDLDKSDQNEEDGVVIYVAIQYEKKDFGDPWDYVMLNRVKGGVVRQTGSISCKSLSFRYKVYGDAYDANGNRVGLKGAEVSYNGELNNPKIGTTYYIDGPKDYYYNMGATYSVIAGFMRATLSNDVQFEAAIDISSL